MKNILILHETLYIVYNILLIHRYELKNMEEYSTKKQ